MHFLKIDENTTLTDLSEVVGYQNVDAVLVLNGLKRTPNVGKALKRLTDEAKTTDIADTWEKIIQKKVSIMNQCSEDAEVFETAAFLDANGWNIFANTGTFEGTLKIPDFIELPKTEDVIGDSTKRISKSEYEAFMYSVEHGVNPVHDVANYQDYVIAKNANINKHTGIEAFNWFKLPFGDVTLYSSIAGESIDFPCYPSEFSDGMTANYDTMSDMLYQYEPWQVYKSSGPRKCTLTFDMHRDMWSGNHEDGKCNDLIRFCEANCYPEYNGAAVNTALVTMYIKGKALVTGILTDVTPNWDTDSPIGHDGFYLHVKLQLTITEVSQSRLDFHTVRAKELIG